MTLGNLKLLLGPTQTVAFRAYLVGTLAQADNGQTYKEEHLNKHVQTNLPAGWRNVS